MTKLKSINLAILIASVSIQLLVVHINAESIQLSSILPKLKAIHEDAQTLLIKNSEIKAQILLGLQKQNEARLRQVKEAKLASQSGQSVKPQQSNNPKAASRVNPSQPVVIDDKAAKANPNASTEIDYSELEEFNRWVDINLDYAVKNTHASIEAFKEEAQQNNGMVDYSEQAIKDGIEGVKYWQSAIIFQDKTLKNEKIEME